MMWGALKSDLIKFQHTWILPLVILAAVGVNSLTGVHYLVSWHEMAPPGVNHWVGLIQNVNFLTIPAIVLGVALLASLMNGMEHQGNTWKQLLALPISRLKIYSSKLIWLLLYLLFASVLTMVGTLLTGYLLGFGSNPIPWHAVLQEGFGPYVASYALIGLQLLLSVLIANQSFAICVGIVGVIISFAHVVAKVVPSWIPWVYPGDAAAYSRTPGQAIFLSLIVCVALLCLGIYWFTKKQIQ
ncbi:ABC transporter permease [Alicyclobacillus acidiphilus]|uniref:ABC transporter permease n=1 Tax=Alicyclobacillus acidiphilus TaxID=182455 RepID=UPI0008354C0A|nr:ABC transporter permease [Alicyclobacillus acidiphilus]